MPQASTATPLVHCASGALENDQPARPAGDDGLNALRRVYPEMPVPVLAALARLMSRPNNPWPFAHVLKLAQEHWQQGGSAQHGLSPKPHPVKADSPIVADLLDVFRGQCVSSNQVPPNNIANSRV